MSNGNKKRTAGQTKGPPGPPCLAISLPPIAYIVIYNIHISPLLYKTMNILYSIYTVYIYMCVYMYISDNIMYIALFGV